MFNEVVSQLLSPVGLITSGAVILISLLLAAVLIWRAKRTRDRILRADVFLRFEHRNNLRLGGLRGLDDTLPALPQRLLTQDRRTIDLLVSSTRHCGDQISFTDERSAQLTYAAVRVRVPDDHRIGKVERPWALSLFGWTIYRETEDDKEHFVLKSIGRLNQHEFVEAINSKGRREGLIFVHGFNNTFEDSLFRTAQIVWDTQFVGVPIVFSWPSRGGALSYLYDRESAVFSIGGFLELLKILLTDTTLTTIHVIAHSMGNQIVMEALAQLSQSPPRRSFGEIIFAAPDVDWDVFGSRARHVKSIARGVTLYASGVDKALSISRTLAQGPRAGDVSDGQPIIVPNVESIDVTSVGEELFGLNHNTFAAQRSLIDDIGRLIAKGDRPPHLRSPQIRPMPEGVEPPHYWRYAD